MRRLGVSTEKIAAVAIILAFPTFTQAGALKAKPGQWKVTVSTNQGGHAGVPQTRIDCVTQDQIDSLAKSLSKPAGSTAPNCKQTDFRESADSVTWKYECTGQYTVTNEGSLKFDSPNHYAGTAKVTGNVMGHPINSVTSMEGTRVGDCPKTGL